MAERKSQWGEGPVQLPLTNLILTGVSWKFIQIFGIMKNQTCLKERGQWHWEDVKAHYFGNRLKKHDD